MQIKKQGAARQPFALVQPFERVFEEYAFRGEYLQGGREVALPLLIVGALIALLAIPAAESVDTLQLWVCLAIVAANASGAIRLADNTGGWRAYRRAVFLPILISACGTGILVAGAVTEGDSRAHEPAMLVLASVAIGLLTRLLLAELITLAVSTSAIMLISLVSSPAQVGYGVVMAILAANVLAIGLASRIERRERQTWREAASVLYELRRLRRDRDGSAARHSDAQKSHQLPNQDWVTSDVDVNALITEILDSHRSAAERLGVQLAVSRTTPKGAQVRSNAIGLGQVLSSLVSNAILYGALADKQPGRVLVGVTALGDHVRISVLDNGIGIAPELHQRVFDAYFRAPGVAHRSPGAGLGLFMAARVIQQLDEHHLQLRSRPGHGTRVNLYLPRIKQTDNRWLTGDSLAQAQVD